jgi:NAD(P)-dependent dehydrogenase (short-subunit alcohol dehydrogenase family)
MLVEKGTLQKDCLKNTTVLLTGGGGGIGYETARALVWLGANVIIAEIDAEKGFNAQNAINSELNTDRAWFYHLDISKETELDELHAEIQKRYSSLDVIFNNATITPLGALDAVGVNDWDLSYAVNLRAPVLLIQGFLPEMKKRNSGSIVFVPSSGAAPYMGAYEVFKTAQVELCNTLAGEIEGTSLYTYSIGPGLVKTDTAQKGIEKVARLMDLSTDEFYRMNEKQMLDAETAGTGFAISVALAKKYNGQEIGAIQALMDAGVFAKEEEEPRKSNMTEEEQLKLKIIVGQVVKTYNEQYAGWLERNIFERQWVLRDFKKTAGMSADEMRNEMQHISEAVGQNDLSIVTGSMNLFLGLKKYYEHQYKLLQGYEKNPQKLKENSEIIDSWIHDLDQILAEIQ